MSDRVDLRDPPDPKSKTKEFHKSRSVVRRLTAETINLNKSDESQTFHQQEDILLSLYLQMEFRDGDSQV